jgi:hypothetical protein
VSPALHIIEANERGPHPALRTLGPYRVRARAVWFYEGGRTPDAIDPGLAGVLALVTTASEVVVAEPNLDHSGSAGR